MTSTKSVSVAMADVMALIPEGLRVNPTWTDMWEAFGSVMESNVESPIRQLENLRRLDADTDKKVAQETARLLGFDLSQDVLDLNADNFTRIVTQLPLYPDQNGTELFVKFIDLALNAVTEVNVRWTSDYVNFSTSPLGPTILAGGTWFKTTHVGLNIALVSVETLRLPAGITLYGRTKELFYVLAPAALVVDILDFDVIFRDADWKGGAAFGLAAKLHSGEATIVVD